MPFSPNRPSPGRGAGPLRAGRLAAPLAATRAVLPLARGASSGERHAVAVPVGGPGDLGAIVEATPDVVYRADLAGRLTYLNPSGHKALGIEPGAGLGGLTLASLHGPEGRLALRERVLPQAHRDGTWSGPLAIRLADGRDVPSSLVFQAHRDADGDLLSYTAIFRDQSDAMGRIAEAERARDRAEAEALAKSDLLARMAHELRTPLTSILGFAEYLVQSEGPSGDRLESLNLIRRNGLYLVDLLNDMLDLSKIELGSPAPAATACSPLAIAGEVAALLSRRAQEKGLKLELAASEDLAGLVEADPLRFRQILINLVANAIKYTESGSVRIELGLDWSGGGQVLRADVIDTGPGLTPEQVARLGESFYRGDPARPRDELGGTGLGLAISWQLARRLGGAIDVRSTPGLGSRFRLTLPTRPVGPGGLASPVSGMSGAGVAFGEARLDCRILLAEDVLSSRRAIAACLEMAGAEVVAVGNGLDAVESALSAERSGRPFDVVLLDIQMPVLDGPGAIRSLRHQGYARPIVALTAESSRQDHREYADLGCDGCVSKPVDWAELIGLIRDFANKS